MAINYEKTVWENGKTVLRASHFEKIEQGIVDIINTNDAVYKDEAIRKANEEERKANEEERRVAIEELQVDYEGLRKVIIDENVSANLQSQINNIIVPVSNTEIEINPSVFNEVMV